MAEEELQAIIQKCQIMDEDDFKEEDFNLFQVAGQKCLEEGYTAQILQVIEDDKNKAIVKCMGWNLVSPLVRCMLKYNPEEDKREDCLKILNQLVQLCNPKELLLGLLEQIEQASGEQISPTILFLLPSLQTVLLKLHSKKAYSVGLSFSTILNQLSLLPVPYTKEQIQEDKLGLCQCCSAVVHFAKPFVDEVIKHLETSSESDYKELKDELLKFCLKSLNYPLLMAELDQLPEDPEDHPLRRFAADTLVSAVTGIYLFFQIATSRSWDHQDFLDVERAHSADSLACLSYLVFVQHLGIECFPMVLSPSYLLQCNMTHIEVLLKRYDYSLLGGLFENCLLRLEDNSLLHQYLDHELLCCFILLFRCLLKTSNHAGVEGYVIQNIKNQIDLSLKGAYDNNCFTGLQLVSLLDLVLSLPEGAETDLLQNSDRIMAALNLLRYLVIKDNEYDNQTAVWTELTKIEQNFLKPLHMGLNMSRAHYEAEIKSKKENRRGMLVCSVTIGGEKMPNMTAEMELQVLHSALFTFDLIESVLARVQELIEVRVKATEENTGIK
uniref:Glomulin, FKBP associated protein n=1 Tax=Sphenodon punctatus TaxID=8508 RepID=A0A8D0GBL6_SPHPU